MKRRVLPFAPLIVSMAFVAFWFAREALSPDGDPLNGVVAFSAAAVVALLVAVVVVLERPRP